MLRAALLAALIPLVSSSVQAYTVVFDPASTSTLRVVQRIDDLTITTASFSGTFDVIFTSDSFNNVQAAGGHPIYDQFAGDPTTGSAVAGAVLDEIVAALNTTNANRVGSVTPLPNVSFYVVYADTTAGSVRARWGRYSSPAGPWENLGSANILPHVVDGYVMVSLVAVPEPAGALLVLAGFGGTAWLRRRRERPRRPS